MTSVLLDAAGRDRAPVDAAAPGLFRPLRLGQVDQLTPGHAVEERPSPPTERAARP